MTSALRGYADLLLTASFTVVVVLLVLVVPTTAATAPLRAVLGTCFLAAAPGYALAALMFPRRGDVTGVERLALSAGLSIVLVPLVGLALNSTPLGVRLAPMAIGVCSLTLAFLGFAALARRAIEPGERFFGPMDDVTLRRAVLGAAAVALFSSGVVAAATLLRPPAHGTEFYFLRPDTTAMRSALVAPGEVFAITLGINNHEGRDTAFVIHIPELGDRSITVPRLGDGESWDTTIDVEAPVGAAGEPALLTFELYREGDVEPYRLLRLFVPLATGAHGPPVVDAHARA